MYYISAHKLSPRLSRVTMLWFKYLDIQSFQICELEMRRLGRGGSSPSPSPTPPPPPSPNCKLEAGVKEINSALCSAMFGLVLSDQAYREFQARQVGQDKVYPSSVSLFFPLSRLKIIVAERSAKPSKQLLGSICSPFLDSSLFFAQSFWVGGARMVR